MKVTDCLREGWEHIGIRTTKIVFDICGMNSGVFHKPSYYTYKQTNKQKEELRQRSLIFFYFFKFLLGNHINGEKERHKERSSVHWLSPQ